MGEIGKMIGQGNTAEIYDYGSDCILKLYRSAMPEQVCRDEFRYTLLAYQATSKAPEPIEVICADGRIGAVYRKIRGKTMLRQTMARLWNFGHYAKCLADFHIEIQKPVDATLPTVKKKLKCDIESVDILSESDRQFILQNLSSLPDGNILCHFDFHPDNIMLFENQYAVIDWMTACRGDKLSDVARTGIILKFSQIPRVSAVVNMLVGTVQKSVYSRYISRYIERTGARLEDITQWELTVAAARLREWIPEKEKQELLGFIQRRISETDGYRSLPRSRLGCSLRRSSRMIL